jgi:hypothetical protein
MFRFLPAFLVVLIVASSAVAQERGRADMTAREEAAIDKGLKYLAGAQQEDGSWGRSHSVANTALALMAFMVKGHMPERPPYGTVMSKGIDYLLRAGVDNAGYMGSSMYEHGLATLALSEAWGMSSRSEKIREGLKKAVNVILKSQSPRGGWRYQPIANDEDVSITVMQVMALASAKEAGIVVPNATIEKAVKYVKSLQNANGGFSYHSSTERHPGFARTAAGVTALLVCGDRNSSELKSGLEYLRKVDKTKFDRLPDSGWYYYGHYYAAVAMFLAGDSYHRDWYPQIRDALLKKQHANGSFGGEEYGTPMAILILGIPYRFIPIYQR